MFAKDYAGSVWHGKCKVGGDPLFGRSHGHKVNSTLGLITPDLELDIDATLQVSNGSRDPGPILVCEINVVAQQFLGLGVKLDVEQGTTDDTRALALMICCNSDGSGPEGDTEDTEKDIQWGPVRDRGECCGLGFEGGAMTRLVQGRRALECRVGGKL